MKSATEAGVGNDLHTSYARDANDDDTTVTVKFSINDGDIFTKAFRKGDTIDDIKLQLARLFSVDGEGIQLFEREQTLTGDSRLGGLGVEALGTIDLTVSTDNPLILNRDLIYGHIPTVDIINVRGKNGSEHVVEIEYEKQEKEWLGGYRHAITKKEYHHASTQTPLRRSGPEKVSKCVQIHAANEKSTNTPITRVVQTSILPSSHDKILTPRACEACIPAKEDEIRNLEERPQTGGFTSHLKKLYEEIGLWNRAEAEKLSHLEEPERRLRRCQVLDITRKLLARADCQRMLRDRELHSLTKEHFLLQVGSPKVIINKNGNRISIDTLETQQVRRLKLLYYDYQRENVLEAKMETVLELRNFFSGTEYEFKRDVSKLLQAELDLLTKGVISTANLKKRIEQYIWHFFKQSANDGERGRRIVHAKVRYLRTLDLSPYRDLLRWLQDDEVNIFKCFSSVCFRMEVTQMYRLVHEIWEDCSARSDCRDLNALRMTRWQKENEWNPSNCLLLTKYELKKHFKIGDLTTEYERCFISKVKNNHFRAQLLFL